MSAIRRYARQIAEKFDPDKIILFGSYAYGQPHEWSDVDILVVMPAYNQISKAIRIINGCRGTFLVGLDRSHSQSGSSVTGRTGTGSCGRSWPKGRSLYEKTDGEDGSARPRTTYRAQESWSRTNPPSMT